MRLLKEIRNLMGNYHVKSGIYHYYRNEFKPAVDFFKKALGDEHELTPSDRRTTMFYLTMTFMSSAERLEAAGEIEEACEDYRHAVEVSPTYPDLRYRWGRALEKGGLLDQAIDQFREAVNIRGNYLEAHTALAFCLMRAERTEEAAEAFERAQELKLARVRDPFRQGMEHLKGGALEQAEELFHQALLSQPGRFDAVFRDALESLKAEDYDASLEHLDLALELCPKYPDLHNYRGIALCELERIDEAVDAFRRSYELQPALIVPRLNLAFAQLRAGRIKEAETELESILEKDPTEPAAKAKLDELRTGRTPERRRTARGTSS
ncbi:hypothetical protein ABI59_00090 [Acidobacteria bacterium Mor1]|nr:hypothetical protein ABI59_00090 [Acidobacteria bacterium Mor1]